MHPNPHLLTITNFSTSIAPGSGLIANQEGHGQELKQRQYERCLLDMISRFPFPTAFAASRKLVFFAPRGPPWLPLSCV
jgi:hypothetical protein